MNRLRVKLKKSVKRKSNNKRAKPLSPERGLLWLALFLILAGIFAASYFLYSKSRYFIVKDVVIVNRKADSSINYADLERMMIDRNIFQVRLKDISDYMLDNYHELLSLRLERAFPDSIIALVVLRKPVAQVSQHRYYPVDEEGVILSGVKVNPDRDLPIINGIRTTLSREIGNMVESKRLKNALALLKEIMDSGVLEGHTLVEIDVSNIRNLTFFLEDGLEVKIGHEDYEHRLEKLINALSDPKIEPKDIRYIDLRFKEPVIGPKWKM